MKRIKTFALWENSPAELVYTEKEIDGFQEAFRPYLTYPELHRSNFKAWRSLIKEETYDEYLKSADSSNVLPSAEYREFSKKLKSKQYYFKSAYIQQEFDQAVAEVVPGRNLGSSYSQSVSGLMQRYEKPIAPCALLYGIRTGEYPKIEWFKID